MKKIRRKILSTKRLGGMKAGFGGGAKAGCIHIPCQPKPCSCDDWPGEEGAGVNINPLQTAKVGKMNVAVGRRRKRGK